MGQPARHRHRPDHAPRAGAPRPDGVGAKRVCEAQQQVEWVNLRVTGIGPITRPEIPTLDKAPGDLRDRAVRGQRPVCFDPDDGYVDTPVIWRADLGAGDSFSGPAIVEEFGSTIPVHPGFDVVVDDWANLVIRKEAAR